MKKFSRVFAAIICAFSGAFVFAQIPASNTNFNYVQQPVIAPVATLGNSGVLTGAYDYAVTCGNFLDAGFLSDAQISNVVTASSNNIFLTNIPLCGVGAQFRNIYRTAANTSVPYQLQYLTTIFDNFTTSYTDNIPDSSLGSYGSWVSPYYANFVAGTSVVSLGNFLQVGIASTSIGYRTGTGYSVTAVGPLAMQSATGGAVRDIAIGVFALQLCTTCAGNTAVGVHALAGDTNGQSNIGIGYTAGVGLNGALNVIALGGSTFNVPSASQSSIAIGQGAFQNMTGSNAIAIGFQAGQTTTSTGNPLFVGYRAGQNATTANFPTFIGNMAGQDLTTGTSNTCVGYECEQLNQTGADNDCMGQGCLLNNTATGSTALGDGALGAETTGGKDIGIGVVAGNTGTNNCTTCNNDVFIGWSATLGSPTQVTNSVALGSQATVSQSNYVQLGNASVTCVGVGTLSWCSGASAPTGTCVSGSLFSNTAGTTSGTNNLYICSQTAWLAVK